jgi:hypothetical protein
MYRDVHRRASEPNSDRSQKRRVDAAVAQLVERFHGKEEVRGSTPRGGSSLKLDAMSGFKYQSGLTVLYYKNIVSRYCFGYDISDSNIN